MEQVQQGALRVAHPDLSYSVALLTTGLDTLPDRHETSICRSLFVHIWNPSHNLHSLLPSLRE